MKATGHCPNLSAPEETTEAISDLPAVRAVTAGDDPTPGSRPFSKRASRTCTTTRRAATCRRCPTAPSSRSTRRCSTGRATAATRCSAASSFQTLLTVGSRIYYETHYAPLLQMQGFANEIALELLCADGRILPVLVNSRQRRDAARRAALQPDHPVRLDRPQALRAGAAAGATQGGAGGEGQERSARDAEPRHPQPARRPHGRRAAARAPASSTPGSGGCVRLLKSSSDNMLKLLDHVLELSRAESSSFALVETPFSIIELVEDVVSTFEAKAREKPVEMRFTADDRVPAVVIGDPVAIRQILTNLVGNAVKFTERGQRRRVHCRHGAHHRRGDAGVRGRPTPGSASPPEVVDRIFNEFTQASYETVPEVRRHRAGPDHHPEAAGALRQPGPHRQRAGAGLDVLVQPAPGPASGGEIGRQLTAGAAAAAERITTMQNYIEGQWRNSSATETVAVLNPATGEELGRTPLSPAAEVDQAAAAAARHSRVAARPGHRTRSVPVPAEDAARGAVR